MQKRPKYETRKIWLSGSMQVETAMQLLKNAPIDPAKPIELVFQERKMSRSVDQNRLYFRRLGEISEQAWFNGKQYSSEAWHFYAKWHILPDEVELKDGSMASKLVETPDGKVDVISTTKLSKGSFAEYITALEAFGAGELGVRFSANYGDYDA